MSTASQVMRAHAAAGVRADDRATRLAAAEAVAVAMTKMARQTAAAA